MARAQSLQPSLLRCARDSPRGWRLSLFNQQEFEKISSFNPETSKCVTEELLDLVSTEKKCTCIKYNQCSYIPFLQIRNITLLLEIIARFNY